MDVPTMAVGASVGSDDDPDGGADGVVVVDHCSVLDDVDLLVAGLLDPLQVAVTRRVLLCGYMVAEATGEFYDDLVELVMIDWWSPVVMDLTSEDREVRLSATLDRFADRLGR
jgi:hypothetical protein